MEAFTEPVTFTATAKNFRHSSEIKMNSTRKLCILNCLYTKWAILSEWIKIQIQSLHPHITMTKRREPAFKFCENQLIDSKVTLETASILWFQNIHCLIHRSVPLVCYFRFSYQNFVWISLLLYVYCMSHSPHPPWFYHSNNTQGVQIMKLLIKQFSSASCYLIPLRSKWSPQHTVLKYPQFMLSPTLRDKVSHQHKTTSKIIASCILIFMLLDSRWQDKRF
jgi:hypothetical protein